MPTVNLISYTGHGHPDPHYAAKLLAYTKNTRLSLTPDGLQSFMQKPMSDILPELDYMATTIASSWEMLDLVFAISNLSRATAQQVTRSRDVSFGPEVEKRASFAMSSQRVTDLTDVTWDVPPTVKHPEAFDRAMRTAIMEYTDLITSGASLEDARDVLPMGVHCNLIAKYNFRSLVEMIRARESLRVQGPYVSIVQQMKQETLNVWPWASKFFEAKNAKAIRMIEEVALALRQKPGAMYQGDAGTLAKAADLLK
jgi:thymidylate synthase ThyX